MLLAAAPVFAAAADAAEGAAPLARSPLSGGELLSMSLNLVLVIVAILVFGWLYMRSQGMRSGRGGYFRVLAAQPLGAKEKVVLLQAGEQQIVIGISAAGMNTLLVPEKPLQAEPSPSGEESGFAERLRAVVGRSRG